MSQPLITDEVGVRFGIGAGVLFSLTGFIVAVRLSGVDGVALLLAATVALATALDLVHAVVLGTAGWAFATGFAVNDLGVLSIGPHDMLRLALFVLAATGAARLGGSS
jgi:hypothetical protein